MTLIVLACAYAVDRPLIPPGIEPAGHTHAFDIYTNPFPANALVSAQGTLDILSKSIPMSEKISSLVFLLVILAALALRWVPQQRIDTLLASSTAEKPRLSRGDMIVSPRIVGLTCIAGLIAFSVVACYAYYPSPEETLEEMRIARGETLTAATAGEVEHALHWIGVWDEWSRKLEVGYAIRKFELRPFQQAQAHLLRKKLELLEHELEHDPLEPEEIRKVVGQVSQTSQRLRAAFLGE